MAWKFMQMFDVPMISCQISIETMDFISYWKLKSRICSLEASEHSYVCVVKNQSEHNRDDEDEVYSWYYQKERLWLILFLKVVSFLLLSPRNFGSNDPFWLEHMFQMGWWKTTNSATVWSPSFVSSRLNLYHRFLPQFGHRFCLIKKERVSSS